MSRRFSCCLCLSAALLAACGGTAVSRSTATLLAPEPRSNGGVRDQAELLLDTQLAAGSCSGGALSPGVIGFARMKVRDALAAGGSSELEYELLIENDARLTLTSAAVVMNGVTAPGDQTIVLWEGEASNKRRLRMRGIVALPKGASTAEFAAALRDRRSALQVRVSDESGSAAGCGDLRN